MRCAARSGLPSFTRCPYWCLFRKPYPALSVREHNGLLFAEDLIFFRTGYPVIPLKADRLRSSFKIQTTKQKIKYYYQPCPGIQFCPDAERKTKRHQELVKLTVE